MAQRDLTNQDISNLKAQINALVLDVSNKKEQLADAQNKLIELQNNLIEKYEISLLDKNQKIGGGIAGMGDAETREAAVIGMETSDEDVLKRENGSLKIDLVRDFKSEPSMSRRRQSSDNHPTAPKRQKEVARITKVVASLGNIFVCGTQGLLARLSEGNLFVYNTETNDDITDMVICTFEKEELLIATTEGSILIFNPLETALVHHFVEPGLRRIEAYGPKICIVIRPYWAKILSLENYEMVKVRISALENVIDFFPTAKFPTHALLTPQASKFLHHASRSDNYEPGNAVSKVKDVCGFIGGLDEKNFCYSGFDLWLLNKDFKVMDSAEFSFSIECIAYSAGRIVVVDRKNKVQVYSTTDWKLRRMDVYQSSFKIKAVAIDETKIFILVDNCVYSYKYTVAPVDSPMMELDGVILSQ